MTIEITTRFLLVIFGAVIALALYLGLAQDNAGVSQNIISLVKGTMNTLFK
jgi:hypothetical protein